MGEISTYIKFYFYESIAIFSVTSYQSAQTSNAFIISVLHKATEK